VSSACNQASVSHSPEAVLKSSNTHLTQGVNERLITCLNKNPSLSANERAAQMREKREARTVDPAWSMSQLIKRMSSRGLRALSAGNRLSLLSSLRIGPGNRPSMSSALPKQVGSRNTLLFECCFVGMLRRVIAHRSHHQRRRSDPCQDRYVRLLCVQGACFRSSGSRRVLL
jgi:hypothetical protein